MSLGEKTDFGRRDALKTLGVASAATVALPLASGISGKAIAGTSNSLVRGSLTVGIMLPASEQRPSPAASFRSGLELYFDKIGYRGGDRRIKLLLEDTGTGVTRMRSASRKLVEKNNADLVVGLANSSATRPSRDL